MQLPATFSGEISCPDCERVEITLNLRPDFIYQLRKTYHGTEGVLKVESQMKRWRYVADDNLIVLGKKKGAMKTYAVTGPDQLRFIDLEGEPEEKQINYTLSRQDALDPFPDTVKMRGMYTFADNVGLFTECSSGLSFTVDSLGDSFILEKKYVNTPHSQGEALLVSFSGKLKHRPGDAESKDVEYIEVVHFRKIYPDQDCSGTQLKNKVVGINWRVIEIGGEPVATDSGVKTPFFFLESKGNRVKGFAGCNRFFGTFLMKGDVFVFNKIASTRMACQKGTILENNFFGALDKTEAYKLEKNLLILLDRNDGVTGKFESLD